MSSGKKTNAKRGRGRPKGSYGEFRAALVKDADKLVRRAVKEALNGDTAMLKVCLERIIPRLRPQASPVKIDAGTSTDLATQGQKVLDAALAGSISPDVARDLLTALTGQARVIEVTELEERLRALEQRDDAPPWEADSKVPLRGKKRRKDDE